MKLFGFEITRAKALAPPDSRGSWTPFIREPFSGAWQRNLEILGVDQCLGSTPVFACHTLICSDVAKNRVKLVAKSGDVWQETTNPAFSPVLRKPNGFQTRIQFIESWMNSKLSRGNAYILKRRDGRGVVVALYVLNPDRVKPLVSDDGQVFYQLGKDNISDLEEAEVIVPAREIIHDRFNCLFHPLVGISPLYAAALLATKATNLDRAAATLAENGVRPGGLLTYPSNVPDTEAKRLQTDWQEKYAGPKGAGKLAVLGNGATFTSLAMTSVDAQVVEQLKYTAEMVCSAYHVPPFMIGVGVEPATGGVQERTLRYYTQCIQKHLEDIEALLDDGLGLDGVTLGTEFDTENLLRLDSVSQIAMLKDGVSAAIYAPNEARAKMSLGPKAGGDSPYLQQQNFSLEALAKRDATADPFGTAKPPTPPPADPAANDNAAAAQRAMALATIAKGLA